MTKPRPLKYLSGLTEEKQHELFGMLERGTSYKKVQEYLLQPAPQGVGAKVSVSTLQRFYARCCQKKDLETRAETTQGASAWLKWAAQGDVSGFDTAALEVIKMRTFQLAESMKDPGEVTQLKNLFAILLATRNAEVRKRAIAVQERTARIREIEAEVRRMRSGVAHLASRTNAAPEQIGPPRSTAQKVVPIFQSEGEQRHVA